MSSTVLLFITTIFTVGKATTLHYTDSQSPDMAGIVSEDGVVDLNEVTTIHCCIIDNCTIV